ncbi:TetR/AcrR family transcriptional regulator [Novosphingobium sp.]|uniref:TetR/AcrR family transcriptional regulator n=1 Tax=Novosphingobium sp. TaxID=1874826 RepID=UPI00260C3800|nr:TetR/AcrR family transcriptional regulator [Novosphingobium sp.]
MVTSETLAKGRLGRQSPDERRENILAVAAEAFALEGYGITSMSTIAARLGGSKATLYKYFTSKEELFQAVMQRKCEAVIGPLEELADTSRDPASLLYAFGKIFLTRLCQPDALVIHRTVHGEGQRFPEVARTFFAYGPEAAYSVLTPAFARFHAEGLIDCPDPRLAAEQFLAMVRGDLHLRVSSGLIPPPDDAEIERQVAHAVGIFVRGISRRDRAD